jgi:hypothetical protein
MRSGRCVTTLTRHQQQVLDMLGDGYVTQSQLGANRDGGLSSALWSLQRKGLAETLPARAVAGCGETDEPCWRRAPRAVP